MQKFLLDLVLFILFFLIIFKVADFYSQKHECKSLNEIKFEELFNPSIKADIAIFGSSKLKRALDPKILEGDNISVYNFGIEAASPEYTYNWYTNFFREYYPNPRLVIMDINWAMFTEFSFRKIEQDSRFYPVSEFINLTIHSSNWKESLLKRTALLNRAKDCNELTELTYNGYTPYPKTDKPKVLPYPELSDNFDTQLEFLKKLIYKIKEDNAEVVLLIMPELLREEIKKEDVFEKNMNFLLRDLEKEKVLTLDYRNLIEADTMFYDLEHLNMEGAKIVSQKLKDDLLRLTYIYN